MINYKKSVTVIIPCRNEENNIGKCLDSILIQTYPLELIKIIVVDGFSDDKTREVVTNYTKKYPFISLLNNPKKITPSAMNIGIKNADGDYILIINSHATINQDFIRMAINCSEKTGADAVGGLLKTKNIGEGIISKSIPFAADSIFGAGGNRYRTRTDERYVFDTLPYCLYRKEVFTHIGLFDEDLIRDQDEEFNYRLLKHGGKIYYSPSIRSTLYIRPTLKKLWNQHFQYGYFKPLVSKKVGTLLTWRQLIPALFLVSIFITGLLSLIFEKVIIIFTFIISMYLVLNILSSLLISYKKGFKYFIFLPIIYITLHFSYGIGYIEGFIKFVVFKKYGRKIKDMPLTR